MIVVPDPEKQSSTMSPRSDTSRMASATKLTGFNSEITSVLVMFAGATLSLLVMEPDSIAGRVPRANRTAGGIGIGVAVAVVLLLFATRPDLGQFLERLHPYSGDVFGTG